jgi:hypothetical protein
MTTHCIVDGFYGIYIPRVFAKEYANDFLGIEPEDLRILLEGPDHPDYWDAWDSVLDHAHFMHDGRTFYLYQDSDLFITDEGSEE